MALAVKSASYDWGALARRREGVFGDPNRIEILEIADACAELASILSAEHGLPKRGRVPATNSSPMPNTTNTKGSPLKIAIFVALEEELDVITKHLGLNKPAIGPAAIGKLQEADLVVLCPRTMGRVAAAIELTRYLSAERIKPDLVICVGLAGGFVEAKIDPGTVICAQTVVDLANRKVTDDQDGNANANFRRQDFDCSRVIYTVATSGEFNHKDWEDHCREHFDWQKGRTPSLREGKIASVDEVVASDDHRKKMANSVDKLLGVEMEAGGFCAAAKSFNVPFAVLRVVSDMADPSKEDDKWRTLGMKTLSELILRLPLKRVVEVLKG